ncbi:MAG: hypothetical protein EXR47_08355 [Dehalococcoidia bacterium]|nr:hypothetical protein [Dehalococcoidia bacterium]
MAEKFDVYADAFLVTITPFGANVSFDLRDAHLNPNTVPTTTRLGTVRMGNEHLKLIVMVMRNQTKASESQFGVKTDISFQILSQMRIAPEDWEAFWK